ncbi:8756_t:CDS:2 [Ambispora gerdemannii]|uniref:8756_t:CDS:1 n=1 Tax=Ambispora gerdemannii TaxID=144530 RepID=A0A9N9G7X7_9GLOM|nr:8756_t:CDS:2 [Ambispora gerdemannii]
MITSSNASLLLYGTTPETLESNNCHNYINIIDDTNNEDIEESFEKSKLGYYKSLGLLTLCICIASFVAQTFFAARIPLDLYLKEFLSFGRELKSISRPSTHNLLINQQDIPSASGNNCNYNHNTEQRRELINNYEDFQYTGDNIPSAVDMNPSALASIRAIISSPEYRPTVKYLLRLSFVFSLFICVPAYLWYIAVNLTTMANLTAIYNISFFFAYLFSILFLGEDLKRIKVFSVVLCIIGVLIMSYGNKSDGNNKLNTDLKYGGNGYSKSIIAGNFIALIGALLYGLYEVLFKKYLSPPTPSILFSNTIVALIGVFTFLFLWIPIPFLHFLEVEEFSLPDSNTFLYIMLIAMLAVAFNASFMFMLTLTSPLVASIGIMLTIPIVAGV